ncbi:DUF445 domain-containing protein [Bacillus sp. B1-b2]|uniref:DUF445 domain-containing protein n=1 Tax=Bacillus sp. B1-b2 TaxID=2653201 RepID=UPI001D01E46F|nr:DUF445 domain-containing protein [Bacillus sp. B1-b2]
MKKKSSRKIAMYSLVIMAIGFIVTFPFQDNVWLLLLHGGFEAGLVGGLADWFAVTALFRHPLGLPIPHTALLPKNRDRMINGLVNVLKKDWLSKESIQDKVKNIPFTEKITSSVENQIQSEPVKTAMIKAAKQTVQNIDMVKITPFVRNQLSQTLSDAQLGKILQMITTQLINEEVDKKTLDHVLLKTEGWLRKDETARKLGAVSMNVLNNVEANGMLQFALKTFQSMMTEDKLGQIVQNLLLSGMRSLQREEESNRKALLFYIRTEIEGLHENEKVLEGMNKWKDKLLHSLESDHTILNSLQQAQNKVVELLDDPIFMDEKVIPFIEQLLGKLVENEAKIDPWITQQISLFIEKNHDQIGNLVKENLDKLDNETLVDMIENNVGKDLQWIRVNGAVCGFIIGLILAGIQLFANVI